MAAAACQIIAQVLTFAFKSKENSKRTVMEKEASLKGTFGTVATWSLLDITTLDVFLSYPSCLKVAAISGTGLGVAQWVRVLTLQALGPKFGSPPPTENASHGIMCLQPQHLGDEDSWLYSLVEMANFGSVSFKRHKETYSISCLLSIFENRGVCT